MKRDNRITLVSCLAILMLAAMAAQTTAAVEKGPYLIYPGDNTQMTVLWQLSAPSSNLLRWGTTTSYSTGSTTPGVYGANQYKYTITGLTPGTLYYYDIANVGSGTFKTAPADNAADVKFMAFGDTRSNPSTHDTVNARMITTYENDPDYQTFAILTADWVNDGTSESQWTSEFFSRSLTNVMDMHANLPVNGSIGNHEGNGTLYRNYWPYSYVGSNWYWSFDYGPVHMVVVDLRSEGSTLGATQKAWLEADLAASTKQWNFLQFHAPVYSAGGSHSNNTNEQSYIQNLCVNNNVDIVFNGHNHYYSRAMINGVHHITTGGGGAPLNSPSPTYPSIVTVSQTNHFCKIDIQGYTLDFEAVTSGGSVIESFRISHEPDDTTPPTPNPMDWLTVPHATGTTTISMTAATAADDLNDVEYFFMCTGGGGNDSLWQSSPTYEDTGLMPNTEYTYQVFARDTSAVPNETAGSSEESARTDIDFPEPGDLDDDGNINVFDLYLFTLQWGRLDCTVENNWCDFADIAPLYGVVDLNDFGPLAENWMVTIVSLPEVVNQAASDITETTAVLNGEITSTGNENPAVTIYWGDDDAGTTGTWDQSVGLGTQGLGAFSTSIDTLSEYTNYYYRCYASNSAGGVWSNSTQTFKTKGSTVPITLDIHVSATNDDTEETISSGGMDSRTSTDLELGWESSASDLKLAGMRFNNINVPNGATVTNAYIEFTVDETSSGTCNLTVFGQLSPDVPSEFGSATGELSNRPRTSAEVDWTAIPNWNSEGTKQQTPDITSVISEITAQGGWAAGNSLVLLVEPDAGIVGKRVAESWDGATRDHSDPSRAPKLHIEYSGTLLKPVVVNQAASGVTSSGAVLNGEITSTGNEDPTVIIYWGETDGQDDDLAWDYSVNLGTQGPGAFSTSIGSLSEETTYYYRCYASNSAGGVWANSTETFDTLAQGSVWYSQNFDSIGAYGTAMPTGWIAGALPTEENYTPNAAYSDEALYVDNGSNYIRGRSYNYGTTGDSDRAVGQMPTSPRDRGIQVALVNNTGAPITSINLTYTGEQWRDNQGSLPDGVENLRMFISDAANFSGNVEYMGDQFSFTAPRNTGIQAAIDGNAAANRIENIGGQYTLTTPIAAGATFYITWHDFEDDNTADHALAIDDVVILLPGTN